MPYAGPAGTEVRVRTCEERESCDFVYLFVRICVQCAKGRAGDGEKIWIVAEQGMMAEGLGEAGEGRTCACWHACVRRFVNSFFRLFRRSSFVHSCMVRKEGWVRGEHLDRGWGLGEEGKRGGGEEGVCKFDVIDVCVCVCVCVCVRARALACVCRHRRND